MAGVEFSTSEMLRRAMALQGAGNLPKAEHLYRSILNEKADHGTWWRARASIDNVGEVLAIAEREGFK
jgi:hypothetical protein